MAHMKRKGGHTSSVTLRTAKGVRGVGKHDSEINALEDVTCFNDQIYDIKNYQISSKFTCNMYGIFSLRSSGQLCIKLSKTLTIHPQTSSSLRHVHCFLILRTSCRKRGHVEMKNMRAWSPFALRHARFLLLWRVVTYKPMRGALRTFAVRHVQCVLLCRLLVCETITDCDGEGYAIL